MIDIVIPTMWMASGFEQALEIYVQHPKIKNIVVIDNNKPHRPSYSVLEHKKISLVAYGKNIYVNPAWNEGVAKSKSSIVALINDDISVDSTVFDMVSAFDFTQGDLIGVDLRGYRDNYKIDDFIDCQEQIVKLDYDKTKPIGGQAWAFGICMFMPKSSYTAIPSLYQVWYGDDYLAQHAAQVYVIKSNRIKGRISETLVKFKDPNSDISRRIELDSKNLIKHFKNARDWDIPQSIVNNSVKQRHQLTDNIFQTEYQKAKNTASDINQHVELLYKLAQQCKTVVELGVRTGVSTRAFLNCDVDLLSFDIKLDQEVQKLFDLARQQGKNVRYIEDDVLNITIDDVDLLFIDTVHTYDQLSQELKLHGNKAQKYLAFHDTYTFGLKGENGLDQRGLLTAIIEFVIDNPHWQFKLHRTNNNGFTVLERMDK